MEHQDFFVFADQFRAAVTCGAFGRQNLKLDSPKVSEVTPTSGEPCNVLIAGM